MTAQEAADAFEGRVSAEVVRRLVDPINRVLVDLRRLILFFFVVLIVLCLGILGGIYEQDQSRTHTLVQINRGVTSIHDQAVAATLAANEARTAAKQASADLATAIKASSSTGPNQQALAHALAEIDCIAKGKEPCP